MLRDSIKVFHINSERYKYLSKTGKVYSSYEFAWGNVLTNKANRTTKEFAMLFSPDGTRAHRINKATFHHFFTNRSEVEHVYFDSNKIDSLVKDLSNLPEEVIDIILERVENQKNKHEHEHTCHGCCK